MCVTVCWDKQYYTGLEKFWLQKTMLLLFLHVFKKCSGQMYFGSTLLSGIEKYFSKSRMFLTKILRLLSIVRRAYTLAEDALQWDKRWLSLHLAYSQVTFVIESRRA